MSSFFSHSQVPLVYLDPQDVRVEQEPPGSLVVLDQEEIQEVQVRLAIQALVDVLEPLVTQADPALRVSRVRLATIPIYKQ